MESSVCGQRKIGGEGGQLLNYRWYYPVDIFYVQPFNIVSALKLFRVIFSNYQGFFKSEQFKNL